MTLADLYAHSADGRVELYWRHTSASSGNITVEYTLDSTLSSGWTTITSALSGSADAYSASFSNSTTPRWFRVTDNGGTSTFADAAYANSGTFRDSAGWSIIPLGVGNVCVFVSTSGSDSNTGYGVASPLQTIAAATSGYAGAGDHILFKRGDSFAATSDIRQPSGVSATQMSMFGAYGPVSVSRPSITGNYDSALIDHTSNKQHVAVVGLDLSYSTHSDNQCCVNVLSLNGTVKNNVVIEDCYLHSSTGGVVIQGQAGGGSYYVGVSVRRCVFAEIYPSNGNHCSGMLLAECFEPLVEDCWFFDCGYLASDRTTYPNTIYNHNIYMSEHCTNVTMRNIVSVGNDLQCRPGGMFERFYCVNQPIGFNAGGRIDYQGIQADEDATYRDIVIDGSGDVETGISRGYGCILTDGTNGLTGSTKTCTVSNVLIRLSSGSGGLTVGSQPFPIGVESSTNTNHVVLNGVVIADSSTASTDYGMIHVEGRPSSLRIVGCTFDSPNSRAIMSVLQLEPSWQVGGNTYYTGRSNVASYSGWFINQIGVSGYTVVGWASHVGDPTSGQSASTAAGAQIFDGTQARLPDYLTHIGLTATVSAFKTACLAQRRGSYNVSLEAEQIIDWVRQDYGMPPLITSSISTARRAYGFLGSKFKTVIRNGRFYILTR